MVLADFGADVVRVDRHGDSFNSDTLTRCVVLLLLTSLALNVGATNRGKRSIAVSLKATKGISLIRTLLERPSEHNKDKWRADVLIDPFRPGVLERLGLDPLQLLRENPRLIIARLTGFRRDGASTVQCSQAVALTR